MDVILAGLIAFGMGYALEGTIGAWLIFTVTGLLASGFAKVQPRGAEKIYWLFVLLVLALVVLSYFGTSLHRYWFILPIVAIVSYFVARLVQKIGRIGKKA